MNTFLCEKLSAYFSVHGGTVNFINLVIAVLGIFLSFYFYNKSRRKKNPVYRCRTTRLIKKSLNKIDNLEVFYDKKLLPALSISKIAFWNAGRETISQSDISGKDRLRLEIVDRYEFLSCDILTQSKDANNFSVNLDKDRRIIFLSFDYIDKEEGVVLRIRHTGSSNADIVIKGSIKTVPEIQRKDNTHIIKKKPIIINHRVISFLRYLLGMLSIMMVITGVSFWFISNESWLELLLFPFSTSFDRIFTSIFFILVGVAYTVLVFRSIKRPVPKSLMDKYMDGDF